MTAAAWLLHVDMDQFLAAAEVRRRPQLAGRPVIVGGSGDPAQPRKVVACASYEARAFGVHAGMPLRNAARRCPDAAFVAADGPYYERASAEVMDVLREFGPVEVWGWDEAFVGAPEDPEPFAAALQAAVRERTQLWCSIGIGDNKLRAKMATGFAKPAGIYQLSADTWIPVLGARRTDALWGIGKRTAARLAELGIETVAELAGADADRLAAAFGPTTGPWLGRIGNGDGDTEIHTEPRVARGRSRSVTYPDDLTDRDVIDGHVAALACELGAEVIAAGRRVLRVAVTVRTKTFYTRTKISKLPAATVDVDEVVAKAREVLGRFELDRPVRLLGVRVELADLPVDPPDPGGGGKIEPNAASSGEMP